VSAKNWPRKLPVLTDRELASRDTAYRNAFVCRDTLRRVDEALRWHVKRSAA
jgi:hypothetical protein